MACWLQLTGCGANRVRADDLGGLEFDPASRTTLHAMAMLYASQGLPLAELAADPP